MRQRSLSVLREQIDSIDESILEFLNKRMKYSIEIAEEKRKLGKKIFAPEREKALLENLLNKAEGTEVTSKLIHEIWSRILKASREKQIKDNKDSVIK